MKWKDNAPYVLCLTHDVDRVKKQWYHYCYYGLKHPLVQLRSLGERLSGKEPYWNFESIVSLENEYGAVSSFLFLDESHKEMSANFMGRYKITDKEILSIIKWLDERGCDIGLHGSFYSYCDPELLTKEKHQLEALLGHDVVSTRQHHLNFEEGVTWKNQRAAGLKYDSTAGYSDRVNLQQPFRTEEGLIEIPLTMMDTMALTEDSFQQCMEIAKDNGVIMLNFHQCHLNSIDYPQNVSMYRRLLSRAKKDGAWITNMKALGEWLDERL